MDFGGRKEVFRALVGSHNYNLNTPESDKDYKVFVLPTFDDLYFNNQFSRQYVGNTEDHDVHDFRKVSSLWWKSNINFIEVLFSNEIIINEKLCSYSKNNLKLLFSMKNELAKMNLPYLYDACVGMHFNKKKLIDKGTEGTQYLVDKYGYDTKQAMHSLRVLDFLQRYAQNDFTDFGAAIKYDVANIDDWYGKLLLKTKCGDFTKEEYLSAAEREYSWIEDNFKHFYKEANADTKTNELLLDIVKEIVRIEVLI